MPGAPGFLMMGQSPFSLDAPEFVPAYYTGGDMYSWAPAPNQVCTLLNLITLLYNTVPPNTSPLFISPSPPNTAAHFQVPNRFFLVIIQYTTHFTAGFRIPPLFVSPEFSGIGRARDDCSCKCSLYYNVTTAMLAFTFLTTLDTTMSSLFVLLLCKLEVLSTLYFQCIKG